jgi:hypothetical protein
VPAVPRAAEGPGVTSLEDPDDEQDDDDQQKNAAADVHRLALLSVNGRWKAWDVPKLRAVDTSVMRDR